MKKKGKLNDNLLFTPLLIILLISILTLAKYSETDYFIKQILWIILGFISFSIVKKTKLKILFLYSNWVYLINVILLILVLFIGREINGARAWFTFKYFSFQPSELMKVSLALFLYKLINSNQPKNIKEEVVLIFKIAFVFFIPSILVFLEPDTGAIILYLIITIVALYYSQINRKWFILLFIILAILIGSFFGLYFWNQDLLIKLIGTSFFYRIDRLISFANNSGYQLNQALVAIGSAGIFGNNSYLYIPEAVTDFMFAFSISRFGFLGALIILMCYSCINLYLINKIIKTRNAFITMFFFIFFFQQLQNILMNLGLLPIMGIPLPFLSYGGTNTIIYFIFLGIVTKIKKVRNFTF